MKKLFVSYEFVNKNGDRGCAHRILTCDKKVNADVISEIMDLLKDYGRHENLVITNWRRMEA